MGEEFSVQNVKWKFEPTTLPRSFFFGGGGNSDIFETDTKELCASVINRT